MKLILASKSPRRIELLKDAGLEFDIIPSNEEESLDDDIDAVELTMKLALAKAENVLSRNSTSTVIAADTIVYYNNKVLGKPKDKEDAYLMLSELSNQTHEVITAVAIINKETKEVFYDSAKVTMKKLSEIEIRQYIETKEPMDKAGSYAIQGLGKKMIESYEGDFFTIMGLPLSKVLKKLALFK